MVLPFFFQRSCYLFLIGIFQNFIKSCLEYGFVSMTKFAFFFFQKRKVTSILNFILNNRQLKLLDISVITTVRSYRNVTHETIMWFLNLLRITAKSSLWNYTKRSKQKEDIALCNSTVHFLVWATSQMVSTVILKSIFTNVNLLWDSGRNIYFRPSSRRI